MLVSICFEERGRIAHLAFHRYWSHSQLVLLSGLLEVDFLSPWLMW